LQITSEGAFELVLIFGYGIGAFLLVSAIASPNVKRLSGPQYRGVALLPCLFGVGIIVILSILFGGELSQLFPRIEGLSLTWTIAAVVGTLFLAVASATLVLLHVSGVVAQIVPSERLGRRLAVSIQVGAMAVITLAILGVGVRLEPGSVLRLAPQGQAGMRLVLEARFPLSAPPLAMALRDPRSGYLALENQGIFFFERPDGSGPLETTKVADVFLPHGLLVSDDVLYVTSTGPFPCESLEGGCHGTPSSFPRADGSIIGFNIAPDGSLGQGRVILEDLPSLGTLHATNGIAEGSDGYFYTPIGNLAGETDLPDQHLLGTVIRYRPGDPEPEVFATGIRNIYDLAIDDEGGLWGIDNDGPSLRGYKLEEVLHITKGADFGYPDEGTYGEHTRRTTPPVFTLPRTQGSAGIEWASRIGLPPGLLIGSERKLEYLPLINDERGYFFHSDGDVFHATQQLLEAANGFLSVVEAGSDGRLWVGTYGYRLESELAIFRLAT
jgi:hypothetical protein